MDKLALTVQALKKEAYYFAYRLEPVYKILNWEWYGKGIPVIDDIIKTLHYLIDCAAQNKRCETGGLEVSIEKDIDAANNRYNARMRFTLEQRIYDEDLDETD